MVLRSDPAPDHRHLFPLPLVPFESMMLCDDRPDYPMMCAAEFCFDGRLDRSKFETAFEKARQRHPLFCALIEDRGNRPHQWVATTAKPQVRYVDDRGEAGVETVPIDLRTEVGVRLSVTATAGQTRLLFDFHHACADGVGGLSFVEDVLAYYAAAMNGGSTESAVLPARDPASLRLRGVFPHASGFSLRRVYNECRDLLETSRFFVQSPQTLADHPSGKLRLVSDLSSPRMVSRTLDPSFLAALRGTAAASQVTVNDLLVRALFLTIRDWNDARRNCDRYESLRLLTPINLRTRAHLTMPASNRLSYAFFTRRLAELRDPDQLLSWLRVETARIRRTHFPERVLSKMGILNSIVGCLPFVLNMKQCLSTAVLSNVGDPTRRFQSRFPRERGRLIAGNLVLTGFTAITPLRPQTRASFFVNTYANHLTIATRLDPQFFGPTEGLQFLDQLTSQLAVGLGTQAARAAA